MSLCLENISDTRVSDKHEIARTIYAETDGASSLRAVEALASMIHNASVMRGCAPIDVACDANTFTSRNPDSPRYALRDVRADNAAFQMCMRVVQKMLKGNLPDACCGATRFHHDGIIPMWAMSRGYIAEICGMLFYL